MMWQSKGLSLKVRRRLVLVAICACLAGGITWGAAPARGPATAPANNKDAAKAQYQKAKSLYDAGKFADAKTENDKALALDPTNVDATLMKKVLEGKLGSSAGSAGAAAAGPSTPAGKPGMLNNAQISMIRLLELGSADNTVRGKIDRKDVEDFWNEVMTKDDRVDKSKQSHDAFISPGNFANQVAAIKQAGERKFFEKLTITSDPAIIVAFRNGIGGRQSVHSYALANCATSECHGGDKGGNFHLITGAASPEQLYTNFYILTMYENKDGRMIDRDSPEKSLLLQYSLPWAATAAKHPKQDIRKIPNTTDARYQGMVEWIRALAVPKPDYGISYEVPGAPAATAP